MHGVSGRHKWRCSTIMTNNEDNTTNNAITTNNKYNGFDKKDERIAPSFSDERQKDQAEKSGSKCKQFDRK